MLRQSMRYSASLGGCPDRAAGAAAAAVADNAATARSDVDSRRKLGTVLSTPARACG
jgi:hypothetical protein